MRSYSGDWGCKSAFRWHVENRKWHLEVESLLFSAKSVYNSKVYIQWDLECRKQQWNNQPITGLAINVVIGSFFRFCFVPPTILIVRESYSASNSVGLIFTMHRNTLRFLLRLQLRHQQKPAALIPCWRFLLLLIRYRLWSSTPFCTLRCHVVNYTVIILNTLLLSLQIVRL